VLKADRAVRHHHDRLSFDLGVAMRHRDRRLFVAAGEKLRFSIAAVVDQRLVQRAEGGTGVGGDVIDVEGFDDIDHEVRAGTVGGVDIDARRRRARFCSDECRRRQWRGRSCSRGGRLLGNASGRLRNEGGGTNGGALQESTPIYRIP
jgi:hypothetical protein